MILSAPYTIDVAEKLRTSINGAKYLVTLIDQYSRYTQVAGLKAKSDTPEAFNFYKQAPVVQKYFPRGVLTLHSDGRGEYEKCDIPEASTTTADTPQHNPFSECISRTYKEPMRAIAEQAGLCASYWEYALDHLSYIKNRLPHSALGYSPFENLTGKKPTLKHVRLFGCPAVVYNERPKSNMHARGMPGIFLGCDDHGVYMVQTLQEGKLLNSAHANFDETAFPKMDKSDSSCSGESVSAGSEIDYQLSSDHSTSENSFGNAEVTNDIQSMFSGHAPVELEVESEENDEVSPRYPSRVRSQPTRYSANSIISIPITCPISVSERKNRL